MADTNNGMFEVLSPWAESDPIPLKGLAPRLRTLAGCRIGLLTNIKRTAEPILNTAVRHLQARYPDIRFTWFRGRAFSVSALEKDRLAEFEEWIRSVDAVIAATAD